MSTTYTKGEFTAMKDDQEELIEFMEYINRNQKTYDIITEMFIYFISDGEFVKIGKSYNPKKRLPKLQTGNPKKLTILKTIKDGDIYTEVVLHQRFSKYRVNGEWFKYSDEIKKFINDLDDGKTKTTEL